MKREMRRLPFLAVLLAALAAAAPAAATPCAERCRAWDAPGASGAIARGPDGNVWYAGPGVIGRITTAGQVTRFAAPTVAGSDVEAGPDGGLWFTAPGLVGRMATDGNVNFTRSVAGSAGPIAPGPDGSMWLAGSGGSVARVAPDTGLLRLPPSGPGGAGRGAAADSLARGPDGALWFALSNPATLRRVGPDGQVTDRPLSGFGRDLAGITAGPDGGMWFTAPGARLVGRISPATGRVISFRTSWTPGAIAAGPSGAVWFAMSDQGRWTVVRLLPSGYMGYFQVPGPVRGLAAGADDGLWMSGNDRIERLEPFLGAYPIRTRRLNVSPFTGATGLRLFCPLYDLVYCAGRIVLRAGGRVVGSSEFAQRANDAPATRIPLNRFGVRLVAARRVVAAVATIDQHDQGGTARRAQYAVTLVQSPR
ncbi:MAG: virginiamycin lyase [Solirubrobacteraceae bacterium]|jgi:virginiamycin B lyase|nr:virginiamycin lyase [Solirubrobacteraceae bacterium]